MAIACTLGEPQPRTWDPGAAPPRWLYEPRRPSLPFGPPRASFGRSQPVQRPRAAGIVTPHGGPTVLLRAPRPWPVPGEPARAIVSGRVDGRVAVELVDLDAGVLVWRDTRTCEGPVVGVTATTAVCAGPSGTRALGLDGKPGWRTDHALVRMTGTVVLVVGADDAELVTLDAASGGELARGKLPPGFARETLLAGCRDEVFAYTAGKLVRFVLGGSAKPWAVATPTPTALEPCTGETVLVRSGEALIGVARATGKITGRVDGVRGMWPARDGGDRLELATSAGVQLWPRDLAGDPVTEDLPPLGELLDARGDRRLVRSSPHTAVLLDRDGVHSYFALAADGAVLGATAIAAATWLGDASPNASLRVVGIPARTRRIVRVPGPRAGVEVAAELRDLPAAAALDTNAAIVQADAGKHAVAALALDPVEPSTIYAAALETDGADRATLAGLDLAKRAWRWRRADGCGPGTPIAVALAGDIVACAARGSPATGTVRATTRAGVPAWQWQGDNVDALDGAGGYLLARDGARLVVLDARDGSVQGRFESDDGAPMRAAIVVTPDRDWLVTYERDRLVVRLPRTGMLPLWSYRVAGVIDELSASGSGVLVALDDGDAYRIELPDGTIRPLPGLNLAWRASGDLVTGHTAGGPIPGAPLPRPKEVVPVRRGRPPPRRPPADDRNPDPPTLWKPFPMPPPLGASWQLTLYELGGGMRARNDYALAAPVIPAPRGPADSPLVVAYGPALREAIVIDPRTGDPVRRVTLPGPALVFGTIVDGSPVAGALLAAPLRAVTF